MIQHKHSLILFLTISVFSFLACREFSQGDRGVNQQLQIIPIPNSVVINKGSISISNGVSFAAKNIEEDLTDKYIDYVSYVDIVEIVESGGVRFFYQ